MINLFQQVVASINGNPHGWTTPEKGCIMAATIVALRPRFSIEIGVYAGKGLVAMGLAHKAIGHGMTIGVDPYSATASVEGQVKAEDKDFWGKLDHEAVFKLAQQNIFTHAVQNTCKIERCRSDKFDPPDGVGVLRIDGNHSEMALKDALRFSPFVVRGGILFLDDFDWSGGGVEKAFNALLSAGWKKIYELDEKENGGRTMVLQKL